MTTWQEEDRGWQSKEVKPHAACEKNIYLNHNPASFVHKVSFATGAFFVSRGRSNSRSHETMLEVHRELKKVGHCGWPVYHVS